MFAVFVASLAAGVAIATGLLGPQWQVFGGDVVERSVFSVFVVSGAAFTGAAVFLPLVILIALAEAFRIRSIVAYLAAGALLLVVIYHTSGLAPPSYEESIDQSLAHGRMSPIDNYPLVDALRALFSFL